MARRFSSPSAANIGAARDALCELALPLDISRNVRQLSCPTLVVHSECFGAPCRRDSIEA
jgi:hypothetical protein